MQILSTSHLSKQYGKGESLVKALDDVNVSVSEGQFAAVIGTSGSGKSTLLNMLGGLDDPCFAEGASASFFKTTILSPISRHMKTLSCPFGWTVKPRMNPF